MPLYPHLVDAEGDPPASIGKTQSDQYKKGDIRVDLIPTTN